MSCFEPLFLNCFQVSRPIWIVMTHVNLTKKMREIGKAPLKGPGQFEIRVSFWKKNETMIFSSFESAKTHVPAELRLPVADVKMKLDRVKIWMSCDYKFCYQLGRINLNCFRKVTFYKLAKFSLPNWLKNCSRRATRLLWWTCFDLCSSWKRRRALFSLCGLFFWFFYSKFLNSTASVPQNKNIRN